MNFSRTKSIKSIQDDLFTAILNKLQVYAPIPCQLKADLRAAMFEVNYSKGGNILSVGAKQPLIWFNTDGLLQEITVDKESFATTTTWFWLGFSIVYATPGFFDQGSSLVTINVVRDSRLAFLRYEDWKRLKEAHEEFEKLTEVLRSDYEVSRKQHAIDIYTLNTEERCLKYEAEITHLLQYIQLKHVAQYLGMSTDTLGKIRRKLSSLKS